MIASHYPLPLRIGNAVQPHALVERIDVEDVVAGTWLVGRAIVAPEPPGLFRFYRRVTVQRVAGYTA
jgi:hypothetical protein